MPTCQSLPTGRLSPQLWVKGELVGGSDIMIDMYNSGDLQKLINEAVGADESDA